MRRLAVVVLAACAMAASALATPWPGRPTTPPPQLRQPGPPPVWVETASRSAWMAFSSYCWRTTSADTRNAVCVDMIPPQSRRDLPVLTVRRGQMLRMHVPFAPREAHVTLFNGTRFKHYVLPARRVVAWRVSGGGVLSLDVRAAAGSAAYLVRLRLRQPA